MTVFGYLRVSTDEQDAQNQKVGVLNLAKSQNLQIDEWIEDWRIKNE